MVSIVTEGGSTSMNPAFAQLIWGGHLSVIME